MKVAINTSSFGEFDQTPMEMLKAQGYACQLNPYKRTLKEDEVISFAGEVDGLIAGLEPLSKKVLDRLPNIKVISRCGVGVNNVDMECAKGRNIIVMSTPDGPTRAVAELTVGLMLDLQRHVTRCDRSVRAGKWEKSMGQLMHSKRVGIIGYGRIGREVAVLLGAFGVQLAVCEIKPIGIPDEIPLMDLKEILAWSDIVTIHAPSADDGKPLIGKYELALMKKGAKLINVSRGDLVDEQALFESLKGGHISGAALDVYQEEPYSGRLKELENVILTPHIGSYAVESRINMEIQAVNNLIRGLKQWNQE